MLLFPMISSQYNPKILTLLSCITEILLDTTQETSEIGWSTHPEGVVSNPSEY